LIPNKLQIKNQSARISVLLFTMPLNNPTSNERQPSSIDRFFWSMGGRFMGRNSATVPLGFGIAAATQFVVCSILTIIAMTAAGKSGWFWILPATFAVLGSIFLLVSYLSSRANRNNPNHVEVRLSGQARRMLYRIGNHIGWYDPKSYWSIGEANASRQGWWSSLMGVKTASQILNPLSAQMLEAGCFQFNRINGLLNLVKEKGRGNESLFSQIKAAASEGMVSLLNQVALMEDNPESQSAIQHQATQQCEKLNELADRFEAMISKPETITDRLSSTTVMDNLLEQMRHESQARIELDEFNRLEQD
jgi:hypothetical protein